MQACGCLYTSRPERSTYPVSPPHPLVTGLLAKSWKRPMHLKRPQLHSTPASSTARSAATNSDSRENGAEASPEAINRHRTRPHPACSFHASITGAVAVVQQSVAGAEAVSGARSIKLLSVPCLQICAWVPGVKAGQRAAVPCQ